MLKFDSNWLSLLDHMKRLILRERWSMVHVDRLTSSNWSGYEHSLEISLISLSLSLVRSSLSVWTDIKFLTPQETIYTRKSSKIKDFIKISDSNLKTHTKMQGKKQSWFSLVKNIYNDEFQWLVHEDMKDNRFLTNFFSQSLSGPLSSQLPALHFPWGKYPMQVDILGRRLMSRYILGSQRSSWESK